MRFLWYHSYPILFGIAMALIALNSPVADLVNQYCAAKGLDPHIFAIGAVMSAISQQTDPAPVRRRRGPNKPKVDAAALPAKRKRRKRAKAAELPATE